MTVFTLRDDRKISKRNMFIYLGVSVFTLIFGIIYEYFSHGVFSPFMTFSFAIPLVLGFLVYLLFTFVIKSNHFSEIVSDLYNAGIATLTIACIYKGVLDIYGTTRELHLSVLTYLGLILLAAGILIYIISLVNSLIKLKKNA